MDFRVLGVVEAEVNGELVTLGRRRERCLLAVLLLERGRAVPADRLAQLLWDGLPPVSARATVQSHVSRLRATLNKAGAAGYGIELATHGPGYLLRVAGDAVDVYRFGDLTQRARQERDPEQRLALLTAALGLWRGPALADVATDELRDRLCVALDEQRLAAVEDRIETCLELGQHRDLLAEIAGLLAEHPLRERLVAAQMLALYRSGRSPDAIDAFSRARATLADELGLDPGPALGELQVAILRNDPSLDLAPAGTGGPRASTAATVTAVTVSGAAAELPDAPASVPRQLPPDPATFVGRTPELAMVVEAMRDRACIVAVHGPGGVGKSALAIRAGHLLADHFPDGQLYIDLQGATSGMAPLEPIEALGRFLRALGVPSSAVPADPAEAAVRFRSLIAVRRVLIFLDNAIDSAQVRLLLPAGAGCGVVVTSRQVLTALDNVVQLPMAALTMAEATSLIGRLAGEARVADEPEATAEVARLCGRLPLALRVAGARLAAKQHWMVGDLVERLQDERSRLDELAYDDLDVRASLQLGYRALRPATRTTLAGIGLLGVPSFAAWAAAAVSDATVRAAQVTLEELVDARLVDVVGRDETGQVRYALHDLTRLFAVELAESQYTDVQRTAARERALGGYLALAKRAEAALPHGYFGSVHGDARLWEPGAAITDRLIADPLAWFECERTSLVACIELAAEHGHATHAWDLANAMMAFFELRSYFDDWRHTHRRAFGAVIDAGDRLGEAVVLRGLAELNTNIDANALSTDQFEQALAIFAELGEPHGEAVCASGLGHLARVNGDMAMSEKQFDRAIDICTELNHQRTLAYALHGLGVVRSEECAFEASKDLFARAVDIARSAGYRRGEAQSLRGLGRLLIKMGHLDEAGESLAAALPIVQSMNDRLDVMNTLETVGELAAKRGDHGEARALFERCVAGYTQLGERFGHAFTLFHLGVLLGELGEPQEAAAALRESVELWAEMELPHWEARTQQALADLASRS